MRNLLRNIPWAVEFAIVIAGAFGLSIIESAQLALHPPTGPMHSEMGMWHSVGLELVSFLILGAFLKLRGWTFDRMGLQSHWMDGLHGIALAVGSYLVILIAMIALSSFMPHLAQAASKLNLLPKVLSPWLVAAVVLVDSFCEEFFVSGYVITVLKERVGETIAINASVAIRLSYHLYAGALGIVEMIPIGLVFGYWYARTGRLWPVMVGHAALNLVALLPYVKF